MSDKPKDRRTYAEKLRDPKWQKKRLEIMERDGFACCHCGDKNSTLNVHHSFYERGKMPWEYGDYMLTTLCEACHGKVEATMRDLGMLVASSSRARRSCQIVHDVCTNSPDDPRTMAVVGLLKLIVNHEDELEGME